MKKDVLKRVLEQMVNDLLVGMDSYDITIEKFAECIDSAYRNQSIYYQDLGEKVLEEDS